MVRQASFIANQQSAGVTADGRLSPIDKVSKTIDRLRRHGLRPVLGFSGGVWRGTAAATHFVDVAEAGMSGAPSYRIRESVAIRIDAAAFASGPRERVAALRACLGKQARQVFLIENDHACATAVVSLLEAAFPAAGGFLFGTGAEHSSPLGDAEQPAALLQRYFEADGRWLPALHAGLRSQCPLLAAEATTTLTPGAAIAAPSNTAWLEIVVDLALFADGDGNLRQRALDAALDGCIVDGDALLDRIHWTSQRFAEDARMNRRLAVRVEGIGDVVAARHIDPSSIDTLREVDRLVADIRARLWQRSQSLAAARGTLPALTERQPSRAWRDAAHAEDWARRWNTAVSKVRVRHRNLLVLSPYAILPRGKAVAAEFADLMPVLAYADAVAFAAPPLPLRWRHADYRYFYARLRAQIERLNATSFIAVGA
ncbi:MAG: hypothetical protein R3315_10895 [Woeseiaceae bacterium]|nr:hypothetical protein [Woeseiaceae bacterium]